MAVVARIVVAPVPMWMIGAGRYVAEYRPKVNLGWVPLTGVRLRVPGAPVVIWGANHVQQTEFLSIWCLCWIWDKAWYVRSQGNTVRGFSQNHPSSQRYVWEHQSRS